ncbi:MAG: response regulator, partial [Deltaproteobacteria bacterium]|nr:response regulator [Deltaproteobacteria bacterium]
FLLPVPKADSQGIRLYLMASAKPESGLSSFTESGLARNARVYMRSGRDSSVYTYPPGPGGAEKAAEADSWRKISGTDSLSGSLDLADGKYLLQYRRLTIPELKEPYMAVGILISKAGAFAEADAQAARGLILLALTTVLSFCLAFFLGNAFLVRPLRLLSAAAHSLAGENPAAPAAFRGFRGEMNILAKAFEEMAASLDVRTQELITATLAADAASKAKSEFLSNMSHEIRTPMNTVVGMAYLALKTDLTPKLRAYVAKIYAAASSLLGIINDILDFSEIEAGRLVMERIEFKLEDLLKDIAAMISPQAEEKGLEVLFGVDANVPPALVGDPLRLGQILSKLLSNALKFTDKGEVIVSCTLDAVLGESIRLRFMIKDTGIGMSQEQQSTLFTAFTQADGSITRRFGGTGLGLTITKRLLDLMNGSIQIASEQGRGTTVTFTAIFGLPPFAPLDEPQQWASARILVVDGNTPARNALRGLLANIRFQADGAASPEEAFALLKQADAAKNPYRIVLMDWRTPGMDGIEATYRLFSELSLSRRPAVLILADSDSSEIEPQAKKAGAAGVLYRPLDKSRLFDSLAGLLQGETAPFRGIRVAKATDSPSLEGLSILLVEDNPINQQVARELLESAGALVTVVDNGRLAVETIRATAGIPPFDLVLMDLQMPEMDGFEATRIIRSHAIYESMPIVAMTAHAMVEDRQKCLDAGMNDHIAKPVEIDKFFATLLRWVRPLSPRITLGRRAARPADPEEFSLPASAREGALNLPGLETEKALARLGNNERLFIKLLRQFVDYHDNTETDFRAALADGDQVGAQRIAHTLKGVAAAIGAADLSGQAALLEASFQDGPGDESGALAARCFSSLSLVQAMLREAFASAETEKQTPAAAADLSAEDKERLAELLDALTVYLQDFDAEAVAFASARQEALAVLLPAE